MNEYAWKNRRFFDYIFTSIYLLLDGFKSDKFSDIFRPLVLTVAYTVVGYCISYVSDHDKKSKNSKW